MPLSAEDIQTKQFHVRFRGFDVEEVDAFLERIAEHFVLLNDEKRLLAEQVEKLEMEIHEFHSQEKTFQHAIISAQKIAEEMQEKSRREADERLTAVREEVNRLRMESRGEVETLQREIAGLKANRQKVKEDLRNYLQTSLDRLEQDIPPQGSVPQSPPQPNIMDSVLSQTDNAAEREGDEEDAPGLQTGDTANDDLNELYAKIELPDEMDMDDQERKDEGMMDTSRQENEFDRLEDAAAKKRMSIPDNLEDDMLFSLEDPLDEDQEPKVTIKTDEDRGFADLKVR
ncbi:MAG: DivIVA domain-containing protein [Deltaproteobacteria bacterium]|nr:DivIVA domain-containing protein [Deltaproteobacteria bacterium]